MFDIDKRKQFETVGELKELLDDFADDTPIYICGASEAWMHVKTDESLISLDTEDLDDDYNRLTEEEWEKAYRDLKNLMWEYMMAGPTGMFGLALMRPLIERYEKGERTTKLYEEMTRCE